MIKNSSSPGNNHPQFEGPIMPKRHGKQARASFLDGTGKRQWHTYALSVTGHDDAAIKSLTGKP
jgi:hypothetical protein